MRAPATICVSVFALIALGGLAFTAYAQLPANPWAPAKPEEPEAAVETTTVSQYKIGGGKSLPVNPWAQPVEMGKAGRLPAQAQDEGDSFDFSGKVSELSRAMGAGLAEQKNNFQEAFIANDRSSGGEDTPQLEVPKKVRRESADSLISLGGGELGGLDTKLSKGVSDAKASVSRSVDNTQRSISNSYNNAKNKVVNSFNQAGRELRGAVSDLKRALK